MASKINGSGTLLFRGKEIGPVPFEVNPSPMRTGWTAQGRMQVGGGVAFDIWKAGGAVLRLETGEEVEIRITEFVTCDRSIPFEVRGEFPAAWRSG